MRHKCQGERAFRKKQQYHVVARAKAKHAWVHKVFCNIPERFAKSESGPRSRLNAPGPILLRGSGQQVH